MCVCVLLNKFLFRSFSSIRLETANWLQSKCRLKVKNDTETAAFDSLDYEMGEWVEEFRRRRVYTFSILRFYDSHFIILFESVESRIFSLLLGTTYSTVCDTGISEHRSLSLILPF